MNRLVTIAVALVLVALLLGYMLTYTVRFNEAVIVSTFGSAGEGSVQNAPSADGSGRGAGAGGSGAGLHFKLPWPVQQVAARYDTRVQIAEGALEQALTADGQSVAVRVHLAWRIVDPLAFYKELGDVERADVLLRNRIRDALSLVGEYRFDQLANTDPARVKLGEIGRRTRARVQGGVDEYGIVVEQVGVKAVSLPAAVTQAVIERMATQRVNLASQAVNEGEARQNQDVTEANSLAQTILSFADLAASDQVNEGQQRAAELQSAFAEDPELAMFLSDMNATRRILADRTTLVIDADKLFPFTRIRQMLGGGEPGRDRPEADEADEADGGSVADEPVDAAVRAE